MKTQPRNKLANCIWHLTNALMSIEECIDNFNKFIETKEKKYWDHYFVTLWFSVNYAKIYDEKLTLDIHIADRLIDFHHLIDKYHSFKKPHPQKVNKILKALYKATLKFLIIEIKKHKKISIDLLEYEAHNDRKDLVPYFNNLIKEIKK